jgi:Ni/Co efflux regulator RcnB
MKTNKRIATMVAAAVMGLAPLAAAPAFADPRAPQNRPAAERREDYRDARRDDRRDARQQARWEARQHNGYTYNGHWYYGAPPASRRGYEPGYRQWRRGDTVPAYYRDRGHQVDWRRAGYRAPPRGYQYVRDDRGAVLLVGIATGAILTILATR